MKKGMMAFIAFAAVECRLTIGGSVGVAQAV